MKIKKILIVLILLIMVVLFGIYITLNKSVEYDDRINNLNSEITQLKEKEAQYIELIERKNQLISNTKNEIINTKKGSDLSDLQEEKLELINEINNL